MYKRISKTDHRIYLSPLTYCVWWNSYPTNPSARKHIERAVRGIELTEGRNIKLQVFASSYVSGCHPPVLSDVQSGASMFVPKTTLRMARRVVAKGIFHESSHGYDFVMVEGDERHDRFPKDDLFPVWFAKALAFYAFQEGKGTRRSVTSKIPLIASLALGLGRMSSASYDFLRFSPRRILQSTRSIKLFNVYG